MWTKEGTVTAVHQFTDSNSQTSWNVLVYTYQQNDIGYLINTGYIAINGPGTQGHGNYCWNDGHNNCLGTPLRFNLNQPLTVEELNNGDFILKNR